MALALISVRDVLDWARREKCFSPMPKTHAEDEKAGDPSSPRGLGPSPAAHRLRYRQRNPKINHPAWKFKSANSLSRSVGPSGNWAENALS
jgi:hypothetical protein